jgi:hypothetical protein
LRGEDSVANVLLVEGDYQARRAAVGLGAGTLALLATATLTLSAGDYLAFARKVRSLQIAADNTAVRHAYQLRDGLDVSEPFRKVRDYQRQTQTLPPGSVLTSDLGAVMVTVRAEWRSPLFNLRRTIVTRSTAAIMMDESPVGSRIARVR